MQQETLSARLGKPVTIDLCQACQSFWFDAHESATLAPGATLRLFRIIGERVATPAARNPGTRKSGGMELDMRAPGIK